MTEQPNLFQKPAKFEAGARALRRFAKDRGLARADHPGTSKDAATRIGDGRNRLQVVVLVAITSNGGLTDEAGIARTGIAASTYRPRRVELVDGGLVRDSGRKALTASGRQAIVWEAVKGPVGTLSDAVHGATCANPVASPTPIPSEGNFQAPPADRRGTTTEGTCS